MKSTLNRSTLLVFMMSVTFSLFNLVGCDTETVCTCTQTTYTYDQQGMQIIHSPTEISCPDGLEEGTTIFEYDDFGRVSKTTTKECKEESTGIL